MNCASLQEFSHYSIVSSPKAEPFKQWLAKVGQERISEMMNPEIASIAREGVAEAW